MHKMHSSLAIFVIYATLILTYIDLIRAQVAHPPCYLFTGPFGGRFFLCAYITKWQKEPSSRRRPRYATTSGICAYFITSTVKPRGLPRGGSLNDIFFCGCRPSPAWQLWAFEFIFAYKNKFVSLASQWKTAAFGDCFIGSIVLRTKRLRLPTPTSQQRS